MNTKHWDRAELAELHSYIHLDSGRGDEVCTVCGRWISEHDLTTEFCSPSKRRWFRKPHQHAYKASTDILVVIAEDRLRFAKQKRAWPQQADRAYSGYGWVLGLQKNPAEKLRALDRCVVPVDEMRAAA